MLPARISRRDVLPASLPPRGLDRVQAATYVGIGATKFDQLVDDGRMPKPKTIDKRRVWDLVELDRAFSALPNEDDRYVANNPWDGNPQYDEGAPA